MAEDILDTPTGVVPTSKTHMIHKIVDKTNKELLVSRNESDMPETHKTNNIPDIRHKTLMIDDQKFFRSVTSDNEGKI